MVVYNEDIIVSLEELKGVFGGLEVLTWDKSISVGVDFLEDCR